MRTPAGKVLTDLVNLVNRQAEDPGLWYIAETAPEAYLQQHLRDLHRAVEKYAAVVEATRTHGNVGRTPN